MAKRSASGITSGGGGGGIGSGGSGLGSGSPAPQVSTAQQNPQPQSTAPQPQNVAPTTSAFDTIRNMSDDELADLVIKSRKADMPNQLADVDDVTQKFVYAANLNEKPQVLSSSEFDAFMKQNNLTDADLLSRGVKAINYKNNSGTNVHLTDQQVADMMMYSKLNYIGGKVGGQALGAGTYFGHTNGGPTGYGTKYVVAALNPSKARVISQSRLQTEAQKFAKSHPKFAKAVGDFNMQMYASGRNNASIYALAMGYNVIWDEGGRGRTNVIDRSVLVYRK